MKLLVNEPLTYISPSTFQQWLLCQYKVYLSKLSGLPRIKKKISRPAMIGILFDAFVKDYICKERGMKTPHINIIHEFASLKASKEDTDIARALAGFYIKSGGPRILLEAKELYLQRSLYLIKDGVPIFGRLDALVDGVIFDWKTRGFGANPCSPTSGYNKRIHFEHGEQLAHEKRDLFDIKRRDWAIQILFYNWLIRNKELTYIIHEICNTNSGFIWVEHRDFISGLCEKETWEQVQQMWNMVDQLDIEIQEPQPKTFMCEKYNTLCDVAVQCTKYMETLGDDTTREFYTRNG